MFLSSALTLVQDLDTKIAKLGREIAAIKASPTKWEPLKKLQQAKAAAEQKLAQLQQETEQLSAQEEKLHIKAKKLHDKLYSGTTCNIKELKDTEKELQETELKLAPLAEIILVNLEEIDHLQTLTAKQSQELEPQERDARQYDAYLQRKIEKCKAQIVSLQAKRPQLLANLPKDALYAYNNLYKSKGGLAVSFLENRACKVCRARVPEPKINEVFQDRLTFCESCGRILTIRRAEAK